RVRLEADLGAIKGPLHVRWLQGTGFWAGIRLRNNPGSEHAVEVRETYLWRLLPTSSSLDAALEFTVRKGAVDRLSLDLPDDDLDVQSVETSAVPDRRLGRVKDWRVVAQEASPSNLQSRRRLQVEFQGFVTGKVNMLVHLTRRKLFDADFKGGFKL